LGWELSLRRLTRYPSEDGTEPVPQPRERPVESELR
jgi:hypothetical protein